jgi:hypothetical protein
MKILILVLSHNDNGGIYSEFYKTQKETWDSVDIDDVQTFFYFGNSEQNIIIGNEIHTNTPEGLVNCGYKTIEVFKLINEIDFDFIFRTNSSSYVDKQLLKSYLETKPKENYYSGIIGNHNGIPFCSGSGFILTKDLVKLLIDNENILDYTFIDDVCFGKFLSSKGIQLIPSKRFDIINDDYPPIDYFHYRLKTENRINDIENMKKIHKNKTLITF